MLDFDAGKYGIYVWPAYGLSAAVFVAMIWASLSFSHRWRKKAEALAAAAKAPRDGAG